MISIVIPMYNEEAGCIECIETLEREMSKAFDDFEIVAVSDGSTDNTKQILSEADGKYPHLTVVAYDKNKGKGGAVRTGILKARFATVLYTDCDLAYGTDIIKQMYDALIKSGCDIAIGSRNISKEGYEGYTFIRKLASKIYIRVICIAAGFSHSDSQCGIKCFTHNVAKSIFEKCEVNGFAFDLEALIFAERMGYTIYEHPVTIINHNQGESKVNIISDTIKMLSDLRIIKKRAKRLGK